MSLSRRPEVIRPDFERAFNEALERGGTNLLVFLTRYEIIARTRRGKGRH